MIKAKNRIYFFWASLVGVTFFSIYPTINWLTSHRINVFHLYIPQELTIPFVPEWIWVYLSMYVLFLMPPIFLSAESMPKLGKQLIWGTVVSGFIFLLLPATLGYAREIPDHSPYASIFANLFSIDYPHNMVPSLHVVFSTCIALAIADHLSDWAYSFIILWLMAIVLSTLLVHQHHVLDIISGFMLAVLLRHFIRR